MYPHPCLEEIVEVSIGGFDVGRPPRFELGGVLSGVPFPDVSGYGGHYSLGSIDLTHFHFPFYSYP